MDMVFHAADGEGQQIMIFADGRRICPQARQKVAGKYLLAILGAEDEVNMVLCVDFAKRCNEKKVKFEEKNFAKQVVKIVRWGV